MELNVQSPSGLCPTSRLSRMASKLNPVRIFCRPFTNVRLSLNWGVVYQTLSPPVEPKQPGVFVGSESSGIENDPELKPEKKPIDLSVSAAISAVASMFPVATTRERPTLNMLSSVGLKVCCTLSVYL